MSNGTIKIVLAGPKYRDQCAAFKHPEWAHWMREECPYLYEKGTPLIAYPMVPAFREWGEGKGYETRVKGVVRGRMPGQLA